MMPRNDVHFFGSTPSLEPVNAGDMIQPGFGVDTLRLGGGGARTRMVCGFLGGNAQIHPLLANLPAVMKIELSALPSGDWMARTFTHAARTLAGATQARPR